MLHHYFKTIASHTDLRYLLVKGVCIGDRRVDGLPVLLFQLEHIYVEVIFNTHATAVLGYREFSEVDDLEPYLDEIALPSFL